MPLNDNEIERLAQLIFEKLIEKERLFNDQELEETEDSQLYHVYDDLGNVSVVDETTFLNYELSRLNYLELEYVKDEEFEKANIIQNKIKKIKSKIKKLND